MEVLQTRQKVAKGYGSAVEAVDSLLAVVRRCKRQLETSQDDQSPLGTENKKKAIKDLVEQVIEKDCTKRVKTANKDVHSALTKWGKALDALVSHETLSVLHDASKFSKSSKSLKGDDEIEAAVIDAIALHLLYEGRISLAVRIASPQVQALVPIYQEMHNVLDAFSPRSSPYNPRAVLDWVERNPCCSLLAFQAHRLAFLQLSDDSAAAVDYARLHLTKFSQQYGNEVRILMGSLVFVEQDAVQKQAQLVADLFRDEITMLHGLPSRSPLLQALEIGQVTLQKLQKYYAVLALTAGNKNHKHTDDVEQDKQHVRERKNSLLPPENGDACTPWVELDQLPVDVSVPQVFHSVVICPVSKQPVADSPVYLSCGHVISFESKMRILKPGNRIKCPTCLVDQHLGSPADHFISFA